MAERIRIAAFCFSPRKGNSLFLLDEALAAAAEAGGGLVDVDRFHIGQKTMAPCEACGGHNQSGGECRIKDAFQEARDLWLAGDIILYAFPVYHMGIPAQFKAFIDRLGNSMPAFTQQGKTGVYRMPRFLKVMGLITQGAHLFGGQDLALSYLLNHAVLMRCLPVAGDLPESYTGAAGWTQSQPTKSSLRKLAADNDKDAAITVEAARQVGRRAVETAMIIRSGLAAQHDLLAGDPDYRFVMEKATGRLASEGTGGKEYTSTRREVTDIDLAFDVQLRGLMVVTTHSGDRLNGMTAAWVSRASEQPFMVMAAIYKSNFSHDLIRESGIFAVNYLKEGRQDLAAHFGCQSGRDVDKFATISYFTDVTGAPILKDTLAYLDCRVVGELDSGDHTIFLAEVASGKMVGQGRNLEFRRSDYAQPPANPQEA